MGERKARVGLSLFEVKVALSPKGVFSKAKPRISGKRLSARGPTRCARGALFLGLFITYYLSLSLSRARARARDLSLSLLHTHHTPHHHAGRCISAMRTNDLPICIENRDYSHHSIRGL